MAEYDPQEMLRQIEDLKRQVGVLNPTPELPPRKHFSPADAPELAKFEQFPSQITAEAGKPPGNPWKFRPYPRCLYMARQHPRNGKFVLELERPEEWQFPTTNQWERAMEEYRKFAESCLRTVQSEGEHQAAIRDGWRDSAKEALEYREEQAKAVSTAAAERAYQDRNMSEAAQAEAAKYESEHFGHQAEIPEAPERKRRGRPRKNVESNPAA